MIFYFLYISSNFSHFSFFVMTLTSVVTLIFDLRSSNNMQVNRGFEMHLLSKYKVNQPSGLGENRSQINYSGPDTKSVNNILPRLRAEQPWSSSLYSYRRTIRSNRQIKVHLSIRPHGEINSETAFYWILLKFTLRGRVGLGPSWLYKLGPRPTRTLIFF